MRRPIQGITARIQTKMRNAAREGEVPTCPNDLGKGDNNDDALSKEGKSNDVEKLYIQS